MKKSATNKLTLDIQNFLFDKKVFAWRQNTQGRIGPAGVLIPAAKKGVPDILGCDRGHFFGVEIKKEKEKLLPEQEGFIRSVFQAGGKVFVARDLEVFKSEFKLWQKNPLCNWYFWGHVA